MLIKTKNMRPCIFFIVSLMLLTVFTGCKEDAKKPVKTQEVRFSKEGTLSFFSQKNDSLIMTMDIEIADNSYETQTGLMYRKGMERKQGMLFVFEREEMHAFYMKNTAFPLDLIFIKTDLTIASFQENAEPFNENSLPSGVPVQYVLEVNAGLVQELGLTVGDRIAYQKL